jgi:hypothetical protein
MSAPSRSTLTLGKTPPFFLLFRFLRASVNSVVSTPLIAVKSFSKSICGEFLQASVLRSVRNSHPVNHPFGKIFNSSDNPLP